MSSRYLRVLAALAALVFTFAAVGCGGSDDGGDGDSADTEAISAAVTAGILEDDADRLCNEVVSDGFIEAVYGDVETCIEAFDDSKTTEDVKVADIAVSGDTATAVATEIGGDTDGATGTISLVRVDDAWRVDELGVDYLRSLMRQGLAGSADSDEDPSENPFVDPDVRECFQDGIDNMVDDSFQQLAYDAMANRGPNAEFSNILASCLPGE